MVLLHSTTPSGKSFIEPDRLLELRRHSLAWQICRTISVGGIALKSSNSSQLVKNPVGCVKGTEKRSLLTGFIDFVLQPYSPFHLRWRPACLSIYMSYLLAVSFINCCNPRQLNSFINDLQHLNPNSFHIYHPFSHPHPAPEAKDKAKSSHLTLQNT